MEDQTSRHDAMDALLSAATTNLSRRILISHTTPTSIPRENKRINHERFALWLNWQPRGISVLARQSGKKWDMNGIVPHVMEITMGSQPGKKEDGDFDLAASIFQNRDLALQTLAEPECAISDTLEHTTHELWTEKQQLLSSALVAAIHLQNHHLIIRLLDQGADPLLWNPYFGSPIAAAGSLENRPAISLLIESELRKTNIQTPEEGILKHLLQTPNSPPNHLMTTMLASAANRGHFTTMSVILDFYNPGSSSLLYDHAMLNALSLQKTNPEIFNLFLIWRDIDIAAESRKNPAELEFWIAISNAAIKAGSAFWHLLHALRENIRTAASVLYDKEPAHFTAILHKMCKQDDTESVHLLLGIADRGINYYGNSIRYAMYAGNTEVIDALLAHGANINRDAGVDRLTSLGDVSAAQRYREVYKPGMYRAIQYLIDRGINLGHENFGTVLLEELVDAAADDNPFSLGTMLYEDYVGLRRAVWVLMRAGVEVRTRLRNSLQTESHDKCVKQILMQRCNGREMWGEMPENWSVYLWDSAYYGQTL